MASVLSIPNLAWEDGWGARPDRSAPPPPALPPQAVDRLEAALAQQSAALVNLTSLVSSLLVLRLRTAAPGPVFPVIDPSDPRHGPPAGAFGVFPAGPTPPQQRDTAAALRAEVARLKNSLAAANRRLKDVLRSRVPPGGRPDSRGPNPQAAPGKVPGRNARPSSATSAGGGHPEPQRPTTPPHASPPASPGVGVGRGRAGPNLPALPPPAPPEASPSLRAPCGPTIPPCLPSPAEPSADADTSALDLCRATHGKLVAPAPREYAAIPAIVVEHLDDILVAEGSLASKGYTLRTNKKGRATLTYPHGGSCQLSREDGLMLLPAQVVTPPNAPPYLAIGFPPGKGKPVRALLDTAAAFTVVGTKHAHSLAVRYGKPGRALQGVGGGTPSVDCGYLHIVTPHGRTSATSDIIDSKPAVTTFDTPGLHPFRSG